MIELASVTYKIVDVKKTTNAKVFKDFKTGDLIQFKMSINHRGQSSGGGVYASYVEIENTTQNTSVSKSQSELINLLRRSFAIEKVN